MFSINSCCVSTKTTPVTSVSGWRCEISIGRCPMHWHIGHVVEIVNMEIAFARLLRPLTTARRFQLPVKRESRTRLELVDRKWTFEWNCSQSKCTVVKVHSSGGPMKLSQSSSSCCLSPHSVADLTAEMRTDVRRTVLRKCSTQIARIVVRKYAHCLKWRWSSPGSGSRSTIAVATVHHTLPHYCNVINVHCALSHYH